MSGNDGGRPKDRPNQHSSGAAVRVPSRPCPVCQKMSDPKYRPFCSRHCADVDLARWLGGRYSIPSRPTDEDTDR